MSCGSEAYRLVGCYCRSFACERCSRGVGACLAHRLRNRFYILGVERVAQLTIAPAQAYWGVEAEGFRAMQAANLVGVLMRELLGVWRLDAAWISVREAHKRGSIHFHVLIDGMGRLDKHGWKWRSMQAIAKRFHVNLDYKYKSPGAGVAYVTKYVTKGPRDRDTGEWIGWPSWVLADKRFRVFTSSRRYFAAAESADCGPDGRPVTRCVRESGDASFDYGCNNPADPDGEGAEFARCVRRRRVDRSIGERVESCDTRCAVVEVDPGSGRPSRFVEFVSGGRRCLVELLGSRCERGVQGEVFLDRGGVEWLRGVSGEPGGGPRSGRRGSPLRLVQEWKYSDLQGKGGQLALRLTPRGCDFGFFKEGGRCPQVGIAHVSQDFAGDVPRVERGRRSGCVDRSGYDSPRGTNLRDLQEGGA